MINTPFKDACGDMVPTRGASGTFDSEPSLPTGMPGRSGGLLPEKHRDTAVTPKSPTWVSPDHMSYVFGK
jgi:hypothetical protein